jgi:tungstate transport system ATP-binding protein
MIPVLEMENVLYGTMKKTILDIPSFELYKGDFLGCMGPNGAGKSTFLKLLAFLDQPSSGSITYHGEKWNAKTLPLEYRRRFAVALQQSLLVKGSVYDNVALGLKLRKADRNDIKKKVAEMLELFEISHLTQKSSLQLSGGEAQRVNLARALAIDPEVLFLDEPFSALDFPTKIKLIEDFQSIVKHTSTTTVFISHDLLEIQALSNRLLILIDGQIQQIGQPETVIQQPRPNVAAFLEPWKKHLPALTL